MIAKALFAAEIIHRYGAQFFFGDRESRAGEYPGGYLSEGDRLFRT
jgi:hypothetical protein